tara:strand:+ start:622 stop:1347 length:726 start_codon:yes stop_codon:yes gene_type:complete
MSTDICKSFRSAFTYGDKLEKDLSGQFTECCTSHLDKHPHVDNIDDMFNDVNFTQVAVPIMKCQREKVQGLKSRREQIDAVCDTEENWDDMSTDALLKLPNFMKGTEGKKEFIGTCTTVMRAQDKAAGTTGRKLEVTFEGAKDEIRRKMGPTGTGHWKANMSKIGDFCENDAGYDWGGEKSCCVTWVTEKINLDNVKATSDFDKSLYHYLVQKNKDAGTFTSLQAENNTQDQSLYHQCGLG